MAMTTATPATQFVRRVRLWALAWLTGSGALVFGQRVEVPRVAKAPVVDGVLNDPAWRQARVIDDFTQVSPKEGAAPSERTQARVMYTEEALCIGVRCFDREAAKILARDLRRDSTGVDDDRIRFVLDPYGRGTEGYVFSLTAGGAKRDGVIEPRSTQPRNEWDTIWRGRSTVDAEGWSAEIVIPFRSLALAGDGVDWGFNVERSIRRRQETLRWASPVRSKNLLALDAAGKLGGMRDVNMGLGLDLRPTAVARWSDGDRDGNHDEDFDIEPSFDAFYRVTPSLTSTFSYNTDFAEAEVDERRVNLTRFPLFFPEKRAFFLEDANRFNFGGILRSPLPFHSRTIGLSEDGERVPIRVGSKLTGKAGAWNLGFLGVALDETATLESDEVMVARVGRDVGAESSVGAIFTTGDPRGNGSATTRGLDFRLKNSRMIEGKSVELIGWGMQTENGGGDEEDHGYGLTFIYPNRPVYARLGVQRVGEELAPAMGFVRRPGIYEFTNFLSHRLYQNGWLDTIDLDLSVNIDTDLDLRALSEEYRGFVEFETVNGDELGFGARTDRELLLEDFEISEEVIVPAGEYAHTRPYVAFETSPHRRLSTDLVLSSGEYFDGTRTSLDADLAWRPGPLLRMQAGAGPVWMDLPGGEFETWVARTGVTLTPSPRLRFDSLAQFDTVSDELDLNARLRWVVQPGSDVFLVFNQGFLYADNSLSTLATEAVAKVAWTLRF